MVRIHVGQPIIPMFSRYWRVPHRFHIKKPASETPKMKLPKVIRHLGSEITIYGKKPNYRSTTLPMMSRANIISAPFQNTAKP